MARNAILDSTGQDTHQLPGGFDDERMALWNCELARFAVLVLHGKRRTDTRARMERLRGNIGGRRKRIAGAPPLPGVVVLLPYSLVFSPTLAEQSLQLCFLSCIETREQFLVASGALSVLPRSIARSYLGLVTLMLRGLRHPLHPCRTSGSSLESVQTMAFGQRHSVRPAFS